MGAPGIEADSGQPEITMEQQSGTIVGPRGCERHGTKEDEMRFTPRSRATTHSMVAVLIATTLAALGCSNGNGGTTEGCR